MRFLPPSEGETHTFFSLLLDGWGWGGGGTLD